MTLVEELIEAGWTTEICMEAADYLQQVEGDIAKLDRENRELRARNKRLESENKQICEAMTYPSHQEENRLRAELASSLKRNSELEAELATYLTDAERYRWLRYGDNDEIITRVTKYGSHFVLREEILDAAIDAARRTK